MPHIRFHDLRYSVATYMLSMGVPIAEISAWLGHKSGTTTANTYAYVTNEMRNGAAKWMDANYDPNGDGGGSGLTLEEAILKLFEIVLDEDEIGRIKQRAEGVRDKKALREREFDQGKDTDINIQDEEVQMHVIRGKMA